MSDESIRGEAPLWFEAGSKFCAAVSSGVAGMVQATDVRSFIWSGANSIEERRSASVRLAKTLDDSIAATPEATHFIIAHSHGGNVAIDARQLMSGNAHDVHIITLATPFLSINQRKIRIRDRLFTLVASIALSVLACYAWTIASWSNEHAAQTLRYANILVSLFSITFGVATLLSGVDQAIRKKPTAGKRFSNGLDLAKRINNQTLLATGVLLFAGSIILVRFDAVRVLPLLLPALLVFFLSFGIMGRFLYSTALEKPAACQSISNFKILRSPRDEATLLLFLGKLVSYLARMAASVSIVVSVGAVLLVGTLLYYAVVYAISLYLSYQKCTSLGQLCVVPDVGAAFLLLFALDSWSNALRYLAFGFCICIALILLAGLCKSFFGRELLHHSLNVTVDAYDTPGDLGHLDSIDWCARDPKGSAFGLRHSLHSNPHAVNKVIAYVNDVCAAGNNVEGALASARPLNSRTKMPWIEVAASITTLVAYVIGVSVAYAPSGATSYWCAVKHYFESPGPEGEFTVLVASLENDSQNIGGQLVAELRRRYGLHVIRTCLRVTDAKGFDWSSDLLLSKHYNADLLLWGKLAQEGEIELKIASPYFSGSTSFALTPTGIPEFVDEQMRSHLVNAIEVSAKEISFLNAIDVSEDISFKETPSANLAVYADRVDALVRGAYFSNDPPNDPRDQYKMAWERIRMRVAAGRLMLAAALTNHDGQRVRKAIDHFDGASSILNSSEEHRLLFRNTWAKDDGFARLWDARLNKSADSAQYAASFFLNEYDEHARDRNMNDRLAMYAEIAASAFAEQYSITKSQNAADSAVRLACESLVRLKYWRKDSEQNFRSSQLEQILGTPPDQLLEEEEDTPQAPARTADLRRDLLQRAEKSEASRILARFGRDPFLTFAIGSKMTVKSCEKF